MIRLLKEKDRQKVLDYVTKEPAFNLFIIGDIENYGFDSDFQQLWGAFENNKLSAIMLRYHENYLLYSDKDNYDFSELLKIYYNDKSKTKMISGKEVIINNVTNEINYIKKMDDFFCELKDSDKLTTNFKYQVQSARIEDAEEIYHLLSNIEEFDSLPRSVERIKKKISEGISKLYYIRLNGEIVTVVQTTADNKYSTMVVGVATKKEYRGQGLMSECLSKLCMDVLNDGKTLCLFYDNPKAGRIYHRLGFKTIGKWSMLIEKSE